MIDVYPDKYIQSKLEDGSRVVYALTRKGVAHRVFCSPENFKLMSTDSKLSVDCLTWTVVSIEDRGN